MAGYYVNLCCFALIVFVLLLIRASLFLNLETDTHDVSQEARMSNSDSSRNHRPSTMKQNSTQTFQQFKQNYLTLDYTTTKIAPAPPTRNHQKSAHEQETSSFQFEKESVLDHELGPAAHRAKYFGFGNRASNQGHNRSDWDRLTISECNAQGVGEFLPLREIKNQKLPQAILIGVQKGGTTALHSYLATHPDVETMAKELYFLDETLDYYFLDPFNEPSIPRKLGRELYSQQTLGIAQKWWNRGRRRLPTSKQGFGGASNPTQSNTADRPPPLNLPFRQTVQGNQMMERMIKLRADKKKLEMAVDMTPNYILHSDRIPARIQCLVPWVQIFVMLRDPMERARSQFDMKLGALRGSGPNREKKKANSSISDEDLVNPWGNPVRSYDQFVSDDLDALHEVGVLQDWTKVDFEDFWNSDECWKAWQTYIHIGLNAPIGMGLYALQLKPFLDMLQTIHGQNQFMDKFLAIDNRDLKTDPNGTFQKLLKFLNLRPFTLRQYKAVNSGSDKRVREKPIYELSEETKRRVQIAVEPYNNKLADMLGEEWRNKWN
eukprot:scaffold2072_cov98-Cylindrotheca_fusiformis.AAC.1